MAKGCSRAPGHRLLPRVARVGRHEPAPGGREEHACSRSRRSSRAPRAQPVEVTTINVPDPGPGEALVEGAGVRGVPHRPALPRGRHQRRLPVPARPRGRRRRRGGRATTSPSVAPGDFVVLNWRAVCGDCRACKRGEPWYCFATHNATQKMTLEDGTELSPALGIGAFAEKTLVAAGQCTKVDPSARPAAVGPARLRRDGRPRRGDQHRRRDPRQVRGGDRLRRRRGGRGRGLRAGRGLDDHRRRHRRQEARGGQEAGRHPHGRTAPDERPGRGDPGRCTGGNGADVVIDAVGRPETWKQAFYARDLAGTVVLVGVPTPDMKVPDIPLIDVFGRGGALKSSWYGDCLPSARLPDAGRPLPAGPARPGRVRDRGDRHRRRRGGVREDARAATCCARS